MGYRIDEVLMTFAVYSILGWLINVSLYYLVEKKFDRRSICRGPYSAAFGTAAIAMIVCNAEAPKFLSAIFGVGIAAGMTVQTLAAVLIRLLSGKWLVVYKWYMIPLFGIANVLLYYQIQPLTAAVVTSLPPWVRMILLLVFWMSFIPDFIDGLARMLEYKKIGRKINAKV